ncbi:hypothetical protein QBC35DRAFT_553187, partial [Podospora australis]
FSSFILSQNNHYPLRQDLPLHSLIPSLSSPKMLFPTTVLLSLTSLALAQSTSASPPSSSSSVPPASFTGKLSFATGIPVIVPLDKQQKDAAKAEREARGGVGYNGTVQPNLEAAVASIPPCAGQCFKNSTQFFEGGRKEVAACKNGDLSCLCEAAKTTEIIGMMLLCMVPELLDHLAGEEVEVFSDESGGGLSPAITDRLSDPKCYINEVLMDVLDVCATIKEKKPTEEEKGKINAGMQDIMDGKSVEDKKSETAGKLVSMAFSGSLVVAFVVALL